MTEAEVVRRRLVRIAWLTAWSTFMAALAVVVTVINVGSVCP